MSQGQPLLEVIDLKVWFPIRAGIMQRTHAHVHAVDGVSFSVNKGETLALVGESGCGKTTLGKSILRLVEPTSGTMRFEGVSLSGLGYSAMLPFRRRMQMIFQDPVHSMDPRMQVFDIVAEGIRSFRLASSRSDVRDHVISALDRVELGSDALLRYPHEFSGGQRQRICIARALAVNPEFLICDEATSALDVSVQASILNLLKQLQDDMALTYLFITHDLSVVRHIADRVAVMYMGQIVDESETEKMFTDPKHPYTRALIESAPSMDQERRDLKTLGGEVPSPVDPPDGCRFYSRCVFRSERCSQCDVPFYAVDGGKCRCLLFENKPR